ncbi:MAG: DNA polymerase III subunit beta [Patescibacteria group bacterium]
MNLSCNREFLQKCISSADRVTGKHLSLPILGTVFIATDHKKIIIRATNLEVGVEFQIPATIKTEGSVALPGSLLANILSSITDEQEINISVSGSVGKITTKTKNLTIKGFLPDDFPTIPLVNEGDKFTLPAVKFIQGVKSVVGSAAISDIKPEISSIYIHQVGDFLIFAATDSFRLSEKKIKYQGTALTHGIIIPVKNILEVVRILEQNQEDISFTATKNQFSCAGKSVYITSRVVQGVYPDYEQILPKGHTTEVVMLKQDLLNTLKLSTLFSDKFNKITFTINPQQKKCIIATKNTEIGEIESNLTATLSGEPIELSLNGKHLFDSLGSIEKDSVIIQFNGADKPAVIRGLGDPSFTNLTMPLTQ